MISKRPFLTHSLYTLLYYVIILILYVYSLLSFLLEYITKNGEAVLFTTKLNPQCLEQCQARRSSINVC